MDVAAAESSCRIDGFATLPQLFIHRCRTLGERTAHREKHLGIWRSYSWAAFLQGARAMGLGLLGLGLRRGEVVSILSEDSKEWLYADLGIQCVGGIVSGVYPTGSAEQLAYLLHHSGSRFLIVENEEQLDKFLDIRHQVPDLLKCIVLDREGLQDYDDEQVRFLDGLREVGRRLHDDDPGRFEREAVAARPGDTAILIYTSGTTGSPKGAMISHGNVLSGVVAGLPILSTRDGDEQLCFLPLSHVLERMVSAYAPIAAMSVVNFAESPETVFGNLQEVSPAFFVAVPRVWEKIHSRVTVLAKESTPFGRWSFDRAIACGMARAEHRMEGRPVPALLEIRFRFWDWFVLANLRRMVALDRARRVTSGAAPVSRDLLAWYWAIGVAMVEGYGLTETSPVTNQDFIDPERGRPGSVGPGMPDTEEMVVDVETGQLAVPFGEPGELLIRGPQVMKGYFDNPVATTEAITPDGWLHTGDIVRMDPDGYVWILDRKKELIKYKGFQVPPAELEGLLLEHPAAADVAVIAKPDPEAGEVPKAFVVVRPGASVTPGELMAFVAERVATFKHIREVEFVDAIPKNPSGKILRRVLVDQERARAADHPPQ